MTRDFQLEARCIVLIEQMLKEERTTLRWLRERNKTTKMTEYKIARLEYALGEREDRPSLREFGLGRDWEQRNEALD